MAKKPAAPKPRTGRPSKYTDKLAEEICERIADGETLRSICALEHMPSWPAVRRWLRSHDSFRTQYALAREEQAHALYDEALDTARATTSEDAGAKRLHVDTLKWAAGKLASKVYGDKVQQEHSGAVEITEIRRTVVDPKDS